MPRIAFRAGPAFHRLLLVLAASLAFAFATPAAAANLANLANNVVDAATDDSADSPAETAGSVDNGGSNAGNDVGNNGSNGSADDRPPPNPELDRDVYAQVFRLLFTILAVAVVLESGLAIIFNWRPFIRRFDGRGVRTVIAVFVAWLVASGLQLDLIDRLYAALDPGNRTDSRLGPVGEAITALVLAGGSAGVNNILQSLGFRRVGRAEEIAPRPKPTEAWLAVQLHREQAVGPVRVELQQGGSGNWLLIGTIKGTRPPPAAFAWALRDESRFPTTGGYAVPQIVAVEIRLSGKDSAGSAIEKSSGPLTLAGGAIIDLDIKL